MGESQQKKRKRNPLSCDSCRRKKTKCDRKLPCGSCIKLSIPHMCKYSSPNHINHITSVYEDGASWNHEMHQELINLKSKLRQLENVVSNPASSEGNLLPSTTLKLGGDDIFIEGDSLIIDDNKDLLIGLNPISNEDDYINFSYKFDIDNKKIPFPTLPFLTLLKEDPGSRLFWVYFSLGGSLIGTFFNKIVKISNRWLHLIHEKAQKLLGTKYIKQMEDGCSIEQVKLSITSWGGDIGITYHPHNLDGLPLEHKVLSILHNMAPINEYLSLFTEYLYPFFPLIDETSLRTEISRITGLESDLSGKILHIKFEKFLDPAVIALLIYISKLSYSCLFHNNPKDNINILNSNSAIPLIQRRNFIMKHPVPIDAINIAEECLNKFNLARKQELWVLQAFIFSRIYELYSPEVGDALLDVGPKTPYGVLMQLAFSLSLHKDPDHCMEQFPDPIKNLRRKVWYFLLNLDVMNAIKTGTTISLNPKDYDTKLPYFTETNSNISNKLLEKESIKMIFMIRPLIINIQSLALVILDMKLQIELVKVTNSVRDLEVTLIRIFGRFKGFLNVDVSKRDFFLIQSISYYLNSKMLLVVINFRLYLYYYDKGNIDLELFYYKKVLTTLFYELGDVSKIAIYGINDPYGISFSLMLSPIFGYILHISALVSTSMCVRIVCTLRDLRSNTVGDKDTISRINSLETLLLLTLECSKDLIYKMSKFGHRYFYFWKNKKAFIYAVKIIKDEVLYKIDENASKAAIVHFSCEQLNQLANIVRTYLATSKSEPEEDISRYFDVLDALMTPDKIAGINFNSDDDMDLVQEIQTDNFWCQLHNINTGVGSTDVSIACTKNDTTVTEDISNHCFEQLNTDINNFGAAFFDIFLDVNFKFN